MYPLLSFCDSSEVCDSNYLLRIQTVELNSPLHIYWLCNLGQVADPLSPVVASSIARECLYFLCNN